MPYIKNDKRANFDTEINSLVAKIKKLSDDDKEGVCNYVITRIISAAMKPDAGWRYHWLNRAHGTFLSAAAEFYNRIVRPYENKCIEANGDLDEYKI